MAVGLKFSKHLTYDDHNTKEGGDSGVTEEEFLKLMQEYPEFVNSKDTYFKTIEYYRNILHYDDKTIEKINDNKPKSGFSEFILGYNDEKARKSTTLHERCYTYITWCKWISASIYGKENYREMKMFYEMAQRLGLNLITYDRLIDKEYLESLRIKEENRGIKLTNEQSHVLTLVEEQCRWYHIPSDDQEKILQCFPVIPKFREAEITEVIDDIQFENLIGMATIPGHTLLFGFHLPYINYADEADYKACADHTARLKDILNRLSKAFGSAEFYEYREEDPDMMRMVLSKKGKFAYASLFAEGEFDEEFGTSKRTIPPDAKTYWKTVKKWGMTPAELLTYVMKQKLPVKVFRQEMYWKWASEGN